MSESAALEEEVTDLSLDEELESVWAANEEAEEVAPVEEDSTEKPAEEAEEPAAEGEQEPEEPALEPMHHWKPEVKEIFSTMNRVQQEERIERERQFEQGYQQKAAEANTSKQVIDEFQGMISPVVQDWQRQGMTPAQGLMKLVAMDADLREDPGAAITRIAQQHGVNLDQLIQDQPYIDPQTRQLQEEQRQLRDQLREFQQEKEQQAQHSQQAANDQAMTQIKAFASTTDEAGALKYPYVKDEMVLTMMSKAMNTGIAHDLPSAYEAAIAQLQEHPVFKSQAQQVSVDTQAKVERAKSASKVLKSKPADSASTDNDEDAALLAHFESIGLE